MHAHGLDDDDEDNGDELSETQEVRIGKKRQVVGILVRCNLLLCVQNFVDIDGWIFFSGPPIGYHDPFSCYWIDVGYYNWERI